MTLTLLTGNVGVAAPAGPGCTLQNDWQTVDDYAPIAGGGSSVNGLASSNGIEIASGYVRTANFQTFTWAVRRSLDGGASWETVEQGLPGFASSEASSAAGGPSGEFYVVGSGNNGGDATWIVRKSEDGGASWKTVDAYAGTSTAPSASATGVAVDGSGVVYVAGIIRSNTVHNIWAVRRSADGGASWTTVESFQATANRDTVPFGIAAASSGEVFVTGRASVNPSSDHWLTRSTTNGTQWQNVDDFVPNTSPTLAQGDGVAIDSAGDVVVVGDSYDSSGHVHWIVRKASLVAPSTWTVADDYVAEQAGPIAQPWAATFAFDGELFVGGDQVRGTSSANYARDYLVRRQAPGAAFANNDHVTSALPSSQIGFDTNTAFAATSDVFGSVFTGGAVYRTAAAETWIIRRLSCE